MDLDFKKIFSKTGIIFIALFIILTYVGKQINFSPLLGLDAGEYQFFTLFQFLGPITGGFLGAMLGTISVVFTELINFVLVGKEINFVNIFRLLPMVFAAYYFAKNKSRMFDDKLSILIPLVCIIAFVLHPIGAQSWYYASFWLIPIVVKFFKDNLFLRSLGATFTAHAIGSVIFLYTIPTSPELWGVILPGVVIFERIIFALGISASYVIMNSLLNRLNSLNLINLKRIIKIDEKYVISAKSLELHKSNKQ